ncbi:MAG: hypothetical protein ACTHLW_04755 [Verrucomicrobiota bacterium]
MKTVTSIARVMSLAWLIAFLGFITVGCRSASKVDWNSRVGGYTYDQAVKEFGPPDKSARLSDGKLVADWIQRSRGGGLSFGIGTGISSGHAGVGVSQTVAPNPSDRILRLTFDADDKLIGWSKSR